MFGMFLQVRALASGIFAAASLREQEAQIVERQALGEAFLAQHVVHQRGLLLLQQADFCSMLSRINSR